MSDISNPQTSSQIAAEVEGDQVPLISPGLEESEGAVPDLNHDFEEMTAMVVPDDDQSLKETVVIGQETSMDVSDDTDIMEWAKKLGYRQMGSDVFQKLRQAFGNEECEYCGRLFYNKVDYEAHIRIHTGESI